jgi:hypothetical protein
MTDHYLPVIKASASKPAHLIPVASSGSFVTGYIEVNITSVEHVWMPRKTLAKLRLPASANDIFCFPPIFSDEDVFSSRETEEYIDIDNADF